MTFVHPSRHCLVAWTHWTHTFRHPQTTHITGRGGGIMELGTQYRLSELQKVGAELFAAGYCLGGHAPGPTSKSGCCKRAAARPISSRVELRALLSTSMTKNGSSVKYSFSRRNLREPGDRRSPSFQLRN